MVLVWTPEDAVTRPSILDVLPDGLGAEMSPARCACRRHPSGMGEAQRAAHERIHADWRLLRVAWCDANGYLLADLIRAEKARHQRRFDYS